MANFFRRAGAEIAAFFASAAAPGADATLVQMFAQTVAGVIQLFAEDSDGLIYQVTPSVSICRAMAYYGEDFISNGNVATSGTGTPAFTIIQQTVPGILRSQVSAAGQDVFAAPATTITGGTLNCVLLLGTGELVFECRQCAGNAQDGTNQWSQRAGLGDTLTGDQANGVYFDEDRATFGDNNVRICTANAGTRTKTTTGTAMGVSPTYDRWRFVVNAAATSVQAYFNDTAVGAAVTANITANPLAAWFTQVVKTLGANARNGLFDYCETYQVLSR